MTRTLRRPTSGSPDAVGRWGTLYLNALKELRPKEYARREGTPELAQEVAELDARAEEQYQSVVASLLKEHPEPKAYAERVQHLRTIEQAARETVTNDLLPEREAASPPSAQAPTID